MNLTIESLDETLNIEGYVEPIAEVVWKLFQIRFPNFAQIGEVAHQILIDTKDVNVSIEIILNYLKEQEVVYDRPYQGKSFVDLLQENNPIQFILTSSVAFRDNVLHFEEYMKEIMSGVPTPCYDPLPEWVNDPSSKSNFISSKRALLALFGSSVNLYITPRLTETEIEELINKEIANSRV